MPFTVDATRMDCANCALPFEVPLKLWQVRNGEAVYCPGCGANAKVKGEPEVQDWIGRAKRAEAEGARLHRVNAALRGVLKRRK